MIKHSAIAINEPTKKTLSAEQTDKMLVQICELMHGIAQTIRATNERMDQMEKQIALLTPVTAAQAKAIGGTIKQRAQALACQYGLPNAAARDIATAIRRAVKLDAGVRSVNELARALYGVYTEQIGYWDDFDAMKAICAKYTKGGGRE